jgi:hypothetical protein
MHTSPPGQVAEDAPGYRGPFNHTYVKVNLKDEAAAERNPLKQGHRRHDLILTATLSRSNMTWINTIFFKSRDIS